MHMSLIFSKAYKTTLKNINIYGLNKVEINFVFYRQREIYYALHV